MAASEIKFSQISEQSAYLEEWMKRVSRSFAVLLPFSISQFMPEIINYREMNVPAVEGFETGKPHVFLPAV